MEDKRMLPILFVLAAAAAIDDQAVVKQIADSGRCVEAAENPDARVGKKAEIAPGAPPILSFRYYEGKQHHRFGNGELLLDDAGH